MLDGNDAGTTRCDFGFRGESEVDASGERDDGSYWRSIGVFVMTKWTVVQDAVDFLVVRNGRVLQVDFGLLDAFGEFVGVFVHVIEIILMRVISALVYNRISRYLRQICRL